MPVVQTLKRLLALCLLLANGGPSDYACASEPKRAAPAAQVFLETHTAMGTIFSIYLYAPTEREAHTVAQAAFDEVDRVEELLSNYRPSSELSRINREAALGPVVTDRETFAFVATSIGWSARTNGAFDITVGRLMKAWGFFRANGHVPSAAELAEAGRQMGWQKVILNSQERSVRFAADNVELDPGGIGKGYVVDRMVEMLRVEHVTSALISAGSSTIYAIGAPPGKRGWKVQIPDPEDHQRPISTVVLRDTSLSTSACTEKYFVLDGHRYCHIMNPHTLKPVEDMVQTTAIHPSATASDALSASLFVLGPEASLHLLKGMPEASALLLAGHGRVEHCTSVRWSDPEGGDVCHRTATKRNRKVEP